MALLTKELVYEAIDLALPTIRELVKNHTWGPQGVVIGVVGKGLSKPVVHIMEELGPKDTWENSRGDPIDFADIAVGKARVSRRSGRSTRSVLNSSPWSLEENDYLYQGGSSEDSDLGIGASGAYGETDEACAFVVWNCIWLLCVRKITKMRDQGLNRL